MQITPTLPRQAVARRPMASPADAGGLLSPFRLGAMAAGWGLALALLYLGLYAQVADRAEETVQELIQSMARLQAQSLDIWLAERQADADALADSPLVRQALLTGTPHASGDTAPKTDPALLEGHLAQVRLRYGYATVAVIDRPHGTVRLAPGSHPLGARALRQLMGAPAPTRPRWIELPGDDGTPLRMGLTRAVGDTPAFAGLLLYLEFDVQALVAPLEQARPPGWDGETLLARRTATGIDYIARNDAGVARSFVPPAGSEPGPVELRLLAGPLDRAVGRDRAGRPVFASAQALQNAPWSVLCLQRSERVRAQAERQTRYAALALGALFVFGCLGLLYWRRSEQLRIALRETHLRKHHEHVLRHAAEILVMFDAQGVILEASDAAVRAYGHPRSRLVGMPVTALRPPEARQSQQLLLDELEPGQTRSFTTDHWHADGTVFAVEVSLSLSELDGRRLYLSVVRDVSERQRTETRLRVAASIFERSNAGVMVTDARQCVLQTNPAFARITGWEPHEIAGLCWFGLSQDWPATGLSDATWDTVARNRTWLGELVLRRKNGDAHPARVLVDAYSDTTDHIDQYVFVFSDLSRLKRVESQLAYASHNDALTNLPNRAQLDERLAALTSGTGPHADRPIVLALFNLDHVKTINQSLGYAQGDELLRAAAQRLRHQLSAEQEIYRFGGDEFVALLTGDAAQHYATVVNRVLSALTQPLQLADHAVEITASVGVTFYPEQSATADALLRNADAALREAKQHGGNTWRLYQAGMNASAYDDMVLAADLRSAMKDGSLRLHLQPQYRLADGALVGAEALLRWRHPARGLVPPARFIPLAESVGLIMELGRWVLDQACRIWRSWNAAGLVPMPIAVNISALQFQQPGFVDEVATTMAEHGIPAGALDMEITESLLMKDTDRAIEVMRALARAGVGLSIDDFGTGYSSLSYLRRFPVNKLKIDRSFVCDVDAGAEGAAIANAIIGMAKSLRLRVIAEGVETEAQMAFLLSQGCDEVQGYLCGRPMPVRELSRLLSRRAGGDADAAVAPASTAPFNETQV